MAEKETLSLRKNNDSTGGATVVVASKLPFALTLQLCDFKTYLEPVMGGGQRECKLADARRGAPKFIINGNSYAQNAGPGIKQIVGGGYALTHGIPKEFWEEWLSQHREADYVVNNMIFAHYETASVIAQATEKSELKSGLERLDPNDLPKGIQTDNQRAA